MTAAREVSLFLLTCVLIVLINLALFPIIGWWDLLIDLGVTTCWAAHVLGKPGRRP